MNCNKLPIVPNSLDRCLQVSSRNCDGSVVCTRIVMGVWKECIIFRTDYMNVIPRIRSYKYIRNILLNKDHLINAYFYITTKEEYKYGSIYTYICQHTNSN